MERRTLKYIGLVISMPFMFSFLITGTAHSLPCKGHIVHVGEAMTEVTAKCGEAALKEQRTVKVEETYATGVIISTVTIEEWTYDFGPYEVMQSYRFENGTLREIRNVGYGRLRDFDGCGNGSKLAIGDSEIEAYQKCGEPLAKENREDKIIESESRGKKVRTFIPVVEWTYRYGRDLPGYTVTFENGVASRIRTREFGK